MKEVCFDLSVLRKSLRSTPNGSPNILNPLLNGRIDAHVCYDCYNLYTKIGIAMTT